MSGDWGGECIVGERQQMADEACWRCPACIRLCDALIALEANQRVACLVSGPRASLLRKISEVGLRLLGEGALKPNTQNHHTYHHGRKDE